MAQTSDTLIQIPLEEPTAQPTVETPQRTPSLTFSIATKRIKAIVVLSLLAAFAIVTIVTMLVEIFNAEETTHNSERLTSLLQSITKMSNLMPIQTEPV